MHDPFGRIRIVGDWTREGRVYLVAQAVTAMMRGEPVPPEAALFLGGGLGSWLLEGGDLARDFLKISAPAGSHRQPHRVWSELDEALPPKERQEQEDGED